MTRSRRSALRAVLAQAEAGVAGGRAHLALARQDQEHALIVAPADGAIGALQARVGDYVQPAARLMTLIPLHQLYLLAYFKETQTARMEAGRPVRIEVDALPGAVFDGTVESFAPGTGSEFALLPFEPGTGNFTKIVQRVPVRIRLNDGQNAGPGAAAARALGHGHGAGGAMNVFMFSGQGSQYHQMGRGLYERDHGFAAELRRLDEIVADAGGHRVLPVLYGDRPKAEPFDDLRLTHPAIAMVEIALARCAIGRGVLPDMTFGVSLGTVAAAVIAGALDDESALRWVVRHAAWVIENGMPGGMLGVLCRPESHAAEVVARGGAVAAWNGPSHWVASAREAELAAIQDHLRASNVAFARLPVRFPFHAPSLLRSPALEATRVPAPSLAPASLPVACCAKGDVLDGLDDESFARATTLPIRFELAVRRIRSGCPGARFIDAGPSGTLATLVKPLLPPGGPTAVHAILTPYGARDRIPRRGRCCGPFFFGGLPMSTSERFLVAMLIIVSIPYLVWRLARTDYFAPLVVVQIVTGVVLGPGLLGAWFPGYYTFVFTPQVVGVLNGVGQWAVMLFVWLAGTELDLSQAWRHRRESSITAGLALGVPLAFGCVAAAGIGLMPGWAGPAAERWQFVCGVGMACAVTALPILVLLMEKMEILRQPLGQRILRFASLDDIAIWAVLGIILTDWERVGKQAAFLAAFGLGSWAVRALMARISMRDRWYVGLIWLVACGLAADWCGLHYMVGAFLAGVMLDAKWLDPRQVDALRGHVLLVAMPVFFLSTGLRTNWQSGGLAVLGVAGVLLVVCVGGKLAGTLLAGRLLGWRAGEGALVGWLLQTKALIMIIFANVLLDRSIISSQMFTALLAMAVVSTMLTVPAVTPLLARRGGATRARDPGVEAWGEPRLS